MLPLLRRQREPAAIRHYDRSCFRPSQGQAGNCGTMFQEASPSLMSIRELRATNGRATHDEGDAP